MSNNDEMAENRDSRSYESESEEENGDWEDWREDDEDGVEKEDDSEFVCLFCDSNYASCDSLFEHCRLSHQFDFHGIRKALNLDFYSSFKLINYVRSQVAENKHRELLNHLNEKVNYQGVEYLWNDDKYLKPFLEDDPLLYSFAGEEDEEDDIGPSMDKEELMRDLQKIEGLNIVDESIKGDLEINNGTSEDKRSKDTASVLNGNVSMASPVDGLKVNSVDSKAHSDSSDNVVKHKLKGTFDGNLDARGIKKVNENYFGSYSSFGIHREMISDKARTDAYRQALSENPSLLKGAVVMDVGCGTGILSLFAAQAGASRVIAVEASEKMAKVATQVAGVNGLLRAKTNDGVMEVAQCMVEELDKTIQIQPHSIDVLVSEWMGYCLLYESMLNSVLYARDRWLKPGGAVLPDTATIFVAGFGKGATSLAFWENVYGFNMSSIGEELLEDAARNSIVDVINASDLVTGSSALQTFDLTTMKHDEVDFTSTVELEPINQEPNTRWCYGVVLWFDTGFTSRFCKENPTVLSTSPYTPKTHWSQTVFTFQEPIAISALVKPVSDGLGAVIGTNACPASKIHLRMSIARATEHRCIDISMETTAIDPCGRKRSWPVQLFNLS